MDIKTLVATPCYGGLASTEYLTSMLTLSKTDLVFDLMTIANESLVSRARNACVATFLGEPSYTHLMFIDSDIGFEPTEIGRLLAKESPVVAGIYPKKKRNWAKAARLGGANGDELQHNSLDYVVNVLEEQESLPHEHFDALVTDGYMRVAYAGTGFMLIQRAVFDQLREAFPEDQYLNDGDGYDDGRLSGNFWNFFSAMPHPKSKRFLSEDFGFCYKWRQCGGEIWVNAISRLTHVGRAVYDGDAGRLRK